MKPFLYDLPILPEGFKFPSAYLELVAASEGLDMEPWSFLSRNMALSLSYYSAMLLKYPGSMLIPFAIIQDETGLYNDGWVVLACFEGGDKTGDPAVKIYDFSRPKSSPWDNLGYLNFAVWLEAAKEESSRYKSN